MARTSSPPHRNDSSDPNEPTGDERQPLLNSSDVGLVENPLPLKQIATLVYARISEPVLEFWMRLYVFTLQGTLTMIPFDRSGSPCSSLSSSMYTQVQASRYIG
jgi:hypothetical protein